MTDISATRVAASLAPIFLCACAILLETGCDQLRPALRPAPQADECKIVAAVIAYPATNAQISSLVSGAGKSTVDVYLNSFAWLDYTQTASPSSRTAFADWGKCANLDLQVRAAGFAGIRSSNRGPMLAVSKGRFSSGGDEAKVTEAYIPGELRTKDGSFARGASWVIRLHKDKSGSWAPAEASPTS